MLVLESTDCRRDLDSHIPKLQHERKSLSPTRLNSNLLHNTQATHEEFHCIIHFNPPFDVSKSESCDAASIPSEVPSTTLSLSSQSLKASQKDPFSPRPPPGAAGRGTKSVALGDSRARPPGLGGGGRSREAESPELYRIM